MLLAQTRLAASHVLVRQATAAMEKAARTRTSALMAHTTVIPMLLAQTRLAASHVLALQATAAIV